MFYNYLHKNWLSAWKAITVVYMLILGTSFVSCRKMIEAKPTAAVILETQVFTDNETAISAVTGIYVSMGTSPGQAFTGIGSISLFAGLSADEFTLASNVTTSRLVAYYQNALSQAITPVTGAETWPQLYNLIFRCNTALKNLADPSAEVLNPTVRRQLLGETRFARALFYFYLVNMYGDIPLVTSTDPFINIKLKRSPVADIYNFIIAELKDAKMLLSSDFLSVQLTSPSAERIRPTKWVAAALLARTYLYNQQYGLAEVEASEVISNVGLFDLVALNNVFLKNSKEAIWQLQPTERYFNSNDARLFVIPGTGPSVNQPVYLSTSMLGAFEAGDNRATPGNWINTITVSGTTYRFPFKYKLFAQDLTITASQDMKEYQMLFRLGEIYLIRAEARAQLNNVSGSRSDLLAIRRRAGLDDATLIANDQASLLAAVLHERRVELFSEYGHRWFDLKRTGNINAVMTTITPLKSGGMITWEPYRQLFPIPQGDIDKSQHLTQNPGYN